MEIKMLSRTLSKIIFIGFAVSLLTILSSVLYADDTNGRSDQGFKSVVPDLSGMTLQEASITLPKYDLSLGAVTNELSDVAPGTIISQSEGANSEVARWAVVHVSVARASVALTSADETAAPETAAVSALTPVPESVTSDTSPTTTEIIAPETSSSSGTPATTTPLESTPETATDNPDQEFKSLVPSLKGLTVEKAADLLPQYDLSLGTVSEEESDAAIGTIVSQSEPADKEIPRESSIHVSIAVAKQETTAVTSFTDVIIPTTSDNESDKPKEDTATPLVIETSPEKKVEAGETTEPKTVSPKEPTEKSEEKAEATTASNEPSPTQEEEADKPEEQEVSEKLQDEKELSTTEESATASLATGDYANHKVSVSLSPKGHIQVTRDITMEMSISPPFDENQKLSYQFNISGKAYNSQKPVFTHVFDEEEAVIVTASLRIPGKPWLHSSSKRVKVGAFKLMKIKVPNIVGLSEAKAAALLKSKGLKVGNTRDKIVKGSSGVIEQMPKAGSMRYENDNAIHYVRAIDEKFRISVVLSRNGLETGKSVTIRASIDPKPRKKKVRYRFLIGDKAYNSPTHKWKHAFEEAGEVTVTAEAIINGEGTFVSTPKTFTIAHAWVKPKSVISPFTVTAEQGDVINFESASSYDTNGVVELSWRDDEDNTNSGADFSVNTENLSEGEHWVSLHIKDEKGNVDVSRAQIIITAKAAGEKQEGKQDEVAAKETADADKITQALEEAIINSQSKTQQVSEPEASVPQEQQTLTENQSEPAESPVAEEGTVSSELPEVAPPSSTDSVSGDAAENTDVIDLEPKGFNWGILIWLVLIGIVLLPIFWILKKLTTKPKLAPTPTPQNHVTAKQNINRPKRSSSNVDSDLTDFELGKAAKAKAKKDDLTNFNLDDD